MMLRELIQNLSFKKTIGELKTEVCGLTQDSRKVEKGFLFVAIDGHGQDGHQFIPEAVRRGAAALVISKEAGIQSTLPVIVVEDSRKALAALSAHFYGDPSQEMRVVGITGTNGKTTTTYLLESILKEAGRNPAVIGTINYRFGGKVYGSEHTTPESVDLQKLLATMLKAGVTDVVMEVSSHSLLMERVRGIHFDAVGFTNLTQDHLDYHQDLESYYQAKLGLFTEFLPESRKEEKFAITNMEDPQGGDIAEKAAGGKSVRVGLTGPYDVSCRYFSISAEGIDASVSLGGESLAIKSSLIGQFNLENILVALGIAHSLGIPHQAIQRGIEKMASVPGRMERIPNDRGLLVFVDYAHTPEAIAHVGATLRTLTDGRLITVFGCGGDRDRTKRPLMGKEAGRVSDLVIMTSDNPRTENPSAIIDEIGVGFSEIGFPEKNLLRIEDRKEALKKAIEIARPGDLVLVAGKGHEDYQIIGKKKVHFSDQEILQAVLQGKKI